MLQGVQITMVKKLIEKNRSNFVQNISIVNNTFIGIYANICSQTVQRSILSAHRSQFKQVIHITVHTYRDIREVEIL